MLLTPARMRQPENKIFWAIAQTRSCNLMRDDALGLKIAGEICRSENAMTDQPDYYPLPPAVEKFSAVLRLTAWIGFWVQLVLAVVSSVVLIFAFFSALPGLNTPNAAGNSGSGGGLFFAICGLLVLYFNVYQYFRYTRIARQLKSPTPSLRPSKGYTVQALRLGLMASLVGMALTLIGAGAITGTLFAKSLRQPGGFFNPAINLRDFVQPVDILVVQANTNTILAHFIAIVAILWLLDYLNKPSS